MPFSSPKNVSIEVIPRSVSKRPSGRRFGTLVHSIFATVNLDADTEAVSAMSVLHGRIVAATQDEVAAAAEVVEAALLHPIIGRARQASVDGLLRREVPIVLRPDDGSLAEGVVDLAFQEAAADGRGWTVVDFKTDLDVARSGSAYTLRVVLLPSHCTSTGLPCSGTILAL